MVKHLIMYNNSASNTLIHYILKLFKNNEYIINPDKYSGTELDSTYGFLYDNVDATMKSTEEIVNDLASVIENVNHFNNLSYYRTDRPISGEYYVKGIHEGINKLRKR